MYNIHPRFLQYYVICRCNYRIMELNISRENTVYLVGYSTGQYDDFYIINIFITENEEVAKKWVEKFNKIHSVWKKYFKERFEDAEGYWIDTEKEEDYQHWDRYYQITEINGAFYKPIKFRQ